MPTHTLLPPVDPRHIGKATRKRPGNNDAELIKNSREIVALSHRIDELTKKVLDQKIAEKDAVIAELQKCIAELQAENARLVKRYHAINAEFTAYKCSRAPSQQPKQPKEAERSQSTLPTLFNQKQAASKRPSAPTPGLRPGWRSF